MKFQSITALAISIVSFSSYADSECTIRARNRALSRHEHLTEKSGLALSECVALAEKELGRKGAFNVRSGLYDVDLVRYRFVDENPRTGSRKIVEGEISDDESSETQETSPTANTYRPRRDRCGGDQ